MDINSIIPPFDYTELIMNKMRLLNKHNKNKYQKISLKILGGYTFDEVNNWIKIFNYKYNIDTYIENSDWGSGYNNTIIYLNNKKFHDVVLVFNSYLDLIEENNFQINKTIFKQILRTYKQFFEIMNKKNIQVIFNLYDYLQFVEAEKITLQNKYLVDQLNIKLFNLSKKYKNIFLIDPTFNFNKAGLNNSLDMRNWNFYGNIFDLEQSIMLSYNYSIVFRSLYYSTKKIIVLDLDNTLWGGVIGDTNINNIKINSDEAEGRIYIQFQNYLKCLKNKGILLAICSKNDENIVKNAFKKLKMPLSYSDFTIKKINWEHKYLNILEISKELNLNLNSFVFIDDNPIERDEINNYLSEVSTPNIGSDPSKFIDIIDLNQFFKSYLPLTKEDLKRETMYEAAKKINEDKLKYSNYLDFLKSLNININFENLSNINHNRVHQLLNKTNQFNLTTNRVTIGFLKNDLKNKWKFVISAFDKYGDHGIISFIYGSKKEKKIYIENWVMSCRVFNKYIENTIIFFLKNAAFKDDKINEIEATMIENPKNKVLKNFLNKIGFEAKKESNSKITYSLKTNNLKYVKGVVGLNDKR